VRTGRIFWTELQTFGKMMMMITAVGSKEEQWSFKEH